VENASIRDQVASSLRISLYILFGFAVAVMFFGGIGAITHPERISSGSFLLKRLQIGSYSFLSGWIYLAISIAILVLTIDRWVKILPGFFAYSTLGAIIMLSGRYNGRPVSPREAWFGLFFTISTAALSFTFLGRKLDIIDRVALMTFLCCLAISMTPNPSTMFASASIGLTALLLAWAINYFHHDGHYPSRDRR
jgi:hypothetical protein